VQRILATIRRATMQALRLALVASSLRLSYLRFDAAIESARLQAFPFAGNGDELKSKVNPNALA
jgi:hypothetical protein